MSQDRIQYYHDRLAEVKTLDDIVPIVEELDTDGSLTDGVAISLAADVIVKIISVTGSEG